MATELCWYHQRVSREYPATWIARHQCDCGRMEIIVICEDCQKNYRTALENHGNYDWACESCGNNLQRRIVGKL
jgi:hypothetical protein